MPQSEAVSTIAITHLSVAISLSVAILFLTAALAATTDRAKALRRLTWYPRRESQKVACQLLLYVAVIATAVFWFMFVDAMSNTPREGAKARDIATWEPFHSQAAIQEAHDAAIRLSAPEIYSTDATAHLKSTDTEAVAKVCRQMRREAALVAFHKATKSWDNPSSVVPKKNRYGLYDSPMRWHEIADGTPQAIFADALLGQDMPAALSYLTPAPPDVSSHRAVEVYTAVASVSLSLSQESFLSGGSSPDQPVCP